MKLLIIRAENGEIKDKQIAEGDFNNVLKNVILKTLELWDPVKSDLIIVRHKQEIIVKLPIKRGQYETYSQFNLKRKGDSASFEIPVYLISFENQWIDDNIIDSKVFVVSPYVDDYVTDKIVELAKNVTSQKEEDEETEE
ncbi:MAG: DUF2286 domain-containing protein [Ignisphaera sp.]|nr:DUF2286 domain-containing protein [Ignisphaera sp.]MCX8168158.1 DUF2286 domain-containing protein [Ignisphaera sp.]MDW8085202.1 DUF2286 domain-containing protein [Ignisphaera sp.]